MYASILIPVVIFIVLVPIDVIFQHLAFRSSGWDLGIYHQALSQLSRFDSLNPFVSVHQQHIFNDHFDPILLIVAPLFNLWNSAILLIVIDLAMTLIGLVPILLLLEKKLAGMVDARRGQYLRLVVVCGYLFNDFLWKALLFPSHPTQWAMAFVAWTLYYYELKRFGWGFWISMVLLFACKEEFPFLGVMLGVALFTRKFKLEAILTIALSMLFIVFTTMFRPMFFGEVYSHSAFLKLLFINPFEYFQKWFLTISDLRVWLPVALLTGYFVHREWRRNFDLYIILSAPLFIRLLSLYKDAFNFHYVAIFIPFILIGFIRSIGDDFRFNRILVAQVLVIAFLSLALRPAPFHHPLNRTIGYFKNREEILLREQIIASCKDPKLKLSAPNNWVPHLTDHDVVTMPSVWLEKGKVGSVDLWIWESGGDYFPSKVGDAELKLKVVEAMGGEGNISKIRFNNRIEVWRKSDVILPPVSSVTI